MRLGSTCVLLLTVFLLPGPLEAQQPEVPVITMEVEQVVLYATVRDRKGGLVGDLKREHFRVLEDGIPQEILSFKREDAPVAVGLLVDNSKSMLNKRDEVVAAAKAFVRASNSRDEIFVIHFNEQITYGLPAETPFSGDQSRLDEALERMRQDGRTALYDAIYEALKHLENSELTKKALIVISDGGDNMSLHKRAEVIQEADRSGALFYGIGIYDPLDGDADPAVLRKLAKGTGGTAYFPQELPEVIGLCQTIARDLRNQYMLSYAVPAGRPGDGYRKVRVRVKDPEGRKLTVRTRTGYYSTPATILGGNKH